MHFGPRALLLFEQTALHRNFFNTLVAQAPGISLQRVRKLSEKIHEPGQPPSRSEDGWSVPKGRGCFSPFETWGASSGGHDVLSKI